MKNIYRNVLLISSLLALLSGCASKVEVSTIMNMPSQSGLSLKHISIQDFSGSRYGVNGSAISDKIKANLFQQGYVQVNSNSPYVLVGKASPSRLETKTWSEKHEGKKETWYSYHASIKQSVTVNYAVYLGSKTLTSGSESFSYEKDKSSNDGYTEAKNKLRTSAEVSDIISYRAARFIAKQLSPYRANVNINFLNGDDENIELGIEYVKKERLKQAFSIFDQVANNSSSLEDQAKALHNQGLVKLMQGEYRHAYELISKANLIDPKNMDILDSMKDVERYKVLNDAHRVQTG